jgi:cytochrome c biogenesis protein CcmG/thiol:disulfide interchange protein DsbE
MSNKPKHRPAPNRSTQIPGGQSDVDRIMASRKGSGLGRGPVVWAIVAALVVLAGVIAVVSAGEDDEEATVGTVVTTPDGEDVSSEGELQPVVVDGAPLAPFESTTGDAAIGSVAPALLGFDFDGEPVEIVPGDGPTMVVFLAHWCPHCNNEIPVLNEWRDAGLVPDGLDVVGVSTAVAPNRDFYPPSEWLDDKGWAWPVMADSEANEAAQAWGVTGFPAMMIVDEEGKVLGRASGELGSLALQQFVADALAGTIA